MYLYPPEGQLGVKSGLSQHKYEHFHRARDKNMSSPFKGKASISVTTALRIIVRFDEGKDPVHPLFSHERNGHQQLILGVLGGGGGVKCFNWMENMNDVFHFSFRTSAMLFYSHIRHMQPHLFLQSQSQWFMERVMLFPRSMSARCPHTLPLAHRWTSGGILVLCHYNHIKRISVWFLYLFLCFCHRINLPW